MRCSRSSLLAQPVRAHSSRSFHLLRTISLRWTHSTSRRPGDGLVREARQPRQRRPVALELTHRPTSKRIRNRPAQRLLNALAQRIPRVGDGCATAESSRCRAFVGWTGGVDLEDVPPIGCDSFARRSDRSWSTVTISEIGCCCASTPARSNRAVRGLRQATRRCAGAVHRALGTGSGETHVSNIAPEPPGRHFALHRTIIAAMNISPGSPHWKSHIR